MNPIVQAAIDTDLATLTERLVDVPAEPHGYGRDLSCVTDITSTCDEVDPESARGVAEAVARRYLTPRGGLIDDPDYGLDLRGLCNKGITYTELRALADQAQMEAAKDDRVDHATVSLDYDEIERTLTVNVQLACVDPALGTFGFLLAVEPDGTALLESI